jgi:hypothetical protein
MRNNSDDTDDNGKQRKGFAAARRLHRHLTGGGGGGNNNNNSGGACTFQRAMLAACAAVVLLLFACYAIATRGGGGGGAGGGGVGVFISNVRQRAPAFATSSFRNFKIGDSLTHSLTEADGEGGAENDETSATDALGTPAHNARAVDDVLGDSPSSSSSSSSSSSDVNPYAKYVEKSAVGKQTRSDRQWAAASVDKADKVSTVLSL